MTEKNKMHTVCATFQAVPFQELILLWHSKWARRAPALCIRLISVISKKVLSFYSFKGLEPHSQCPSPHTQTWTPWIHHYIHSTIRDTTVQHGITMKISVFHQVSHAFLDSPWKGSAYIIQQSNNVSTSIRICWLQGLKCCFAPTTAAVKAFSIQRETPFDLRHLKEQETWQPAIIHHQHFLIF